MSDEIAAIAVKTDDVVDTVYDAKRSLVAADDAVSYQKALHNARNGSAGSENGKNLLQNLQTHMEQEKV